MTEEKVEALRSADLRGLTKRERLAVAYVDRYSLDPEAIDEAFQDELRDSFTDEEIVTLALFVWWFSGRHKFLHIFDVPPPEVGESGTWTMTASEAPTAEPRAVDEG